MESSPAEVATPPNLAWSKAVVSILRTLPRDVSECFSYLGPANSVLHCANPTDAGSLASRALYAERGLPSGDRDDPRLNARFPSGSHKRIRLSGPKNQSVVMQFTNNTIHAGCCSPPSAVSAAFSYLLYAAGGNKSQIYRNGYSFTVPNIVLSGRTSFPVSRELVQAADWSNYSSKFPGIAVIHTSLRNNITPELYPARTGSETRQMNFIIPGLNDVEKDLPPTLTLLAELLKSCRPPPAAGSRATPAE
jgi:hypothetical protein